MSSIDGEQVDTVTRSVLDVPVVRVDVRVFNVNRAVGATLIFWLKLFGSATGGW